jgi:hypothetical protein
MTESNKTVVAALAPRRPRRWLRRIGVGIAVMLLAALVTYGILAWQYYRHNVVITRDYAAEMNARIDAISENDRAWTHYRRVLLGIESKSSDDEIAIYADDTNWPATAMYLQRNAKSLQKVRDASRMTQLGIPVQDGIDPADAAWSDRFPRRRGLLEPEPAPMTDAPTLIFPAYEKAAKVAWCGRLLLADAELAATTDDQDRYIEDLQSAERINDQLNAADSFTWLVCNAASANVYRSLLHSLAIRPELLSEANLKRVDEWLAGREKSSVVRQNCRFERDQIDDLLQRAFTDDGQGSGYLMPDELFKATGQLHDRAFTWTDPVVCVSVVANRRETREMAERLFTHLEAQFQTPLWRWNEIGESPREEIDVGVKYLLLRPTMLHAMYPLNHQRMIQYRDAARVAIALIRYQRKHASWPDNLDALVPEFLAAIPPDRFDGQPLRYKVRDGKPKLYSVGRNLADDEELGEAFSGNLFADPDDVSEWPPDKDSIGDWMLWPPDRGREFEPKASAQDGDQDFDAQPPQAPDPDRDAEETENES